MAIVIITAIWGSIGLIISIWTIRKTRQHKQFQKTMKVGDLCMFYKNETRFVGNIVAVFDNNIIVEDNECNAVQLNRKDIYSI